MCTRSTPHLTEKEVGGLGTGTWRTVMHQLDPRDLLAFFAHVASTWVE